MCDVTMTIVMFYTVLQMTCSMTLPASLYITQLSVKTEGRLLLFLISSFRLFRTRDSQYDTHHCLFEFLFSEVSPYHLLPDDIMLVIKEQNL